jgi:hypothetical protein
MTLARRLAALALTAALVVGGGGARPVRAPGRGFAITITAKEV